MSMNFQAKVKYACSYTFLAVALLLSCPVQSRPQAKPLAILTDELGFTNCEDLMARLDAFYSELTKNGSEGLIFINGLPDSMARNVTYEGMIEGWRRFRKFPQAIPIVRGKLIPDGRIQFWTIPRGAAKPELETAVWSYVLPEGTKPFIVLQDSDYGVCPSYQAVRMYADLLRANPRARGNIVVRANDARTFRKEVAELESTLVRGLRVPRKQLRFYSAKPTVRGVRFADVEYWIVP
jgi:hypothetical protein